MGNKKIIFISFLALLFFSFFLYYSFSKSLSKKQTATRAEDQQTDEQQPGSTDNLPLEQQQNIQVTVKIIKGVNGETRFPSAIVGLKWCEGDSLDCTKIESSSAQQVYSDPTNIDQMTPSFTNIPKNTSFYTNPTLRAYLEAGLTRYSQKIIKLCDSVIFIETDKKISSIEPSCASNPIPTEQANQLPQAMPTPNVPTDDVTWLGPNSISIWIRIIDQAGNLTKFDVPIRINMLWCKGETGDCTHAAPGQPLDLETPSRDPRLIRSFAPRLPPVGYTHLLATYFKDKDTTLYFSKRSLPCNKMVFTLEVDKINTDIPVVCQNIQAAQVTPAVNLTPTPPLIHACENYPPETDPNTILNNKMYMYRDWKCFKTPPCNIGFGERVCKPPALICCPPQSNPPSMEKISFRDNKFNQWPRSMSGGESSHPFYSGIDSVVSAGISYLQSGDPANFSDPNNRWGLIPATILKYAPIRGSNEEKPLQIWFPNLDAYLDRDFYLSKIQESDRSGTDRILDFNEKYRDYGLIIRPWIVGKSLIGNNTVCLISNNLVNLEINKSIVNYGKLNFSQEVAEWPKNWLNEADFSAAQCQEIKKFVPDVQL